MYKRIIHLILAHKIKAPIYIAAVILILFNLKKLILWLTLVSLQSASISLFFPKADVYCIISAFNKFKGNNFLSANSFENLNQEIEINKYDFQQSSPMFIAGITKDKIVFIKAQNIMRYNGKTNEEQCITAKNAYIKVKRNRPIPEVILINK